MQVLTVPDKELNSWVSVKKMSQYRYMQYQFSFIFANCYEGHSINKLQNSIILLVFQV